MTDAALREKTLVGVAIMLASTLTLTAMDAAVKWAVADYPVPQVNFVRSVAAILVLLPIVLNDGGLKAFRTTRPALHVARSLGLVLVSYVWFFALGQMKLADLAAIVLMAPLYVTALSVPLLGEKVGARRWLAVSVGFIGMLIVVRPGTGVFNPVALLAMGVSVGYALFMISNRAFRESETLTAMTYYPAIAILLISAAIAPFVWKPLTMNALLVMVFIGICAGLGHLCLTTAFRYAPASVLAPLEYTGLIWAVTLGYVLFDELPDEWAVAGMLLIAGAGIFVVYRESRSGTPPPVVRDGDVKAEIG